MPEPELTTKATDPKGVLQKNMKMFVFLGACALVILAAIFSSAGKKSSTQAASKNQPPQPMVQDNTDNNVADLKSQLEAEKEKEQQTALAATAAGDPALKNATPAQQVAAAGYTPSGLPVGCVPGQPCGPNGYPQQPGGANALSPAQQEEQQIAAKDRERAYNARFSSNLAYSSPPDPPQSQIAPAGSQSRNPNALPVGDGSMIAPRAPGEQPQAQTAQAPKRAPEVNIDSASGQPYVIYEGTTLDTVLMNRLDGDAVGPVKVLVSNPVYSHDHQHVIIPDGTIVLGEAKKIGTSGFGQQRRMSVSRASEDARIYTNDETTLAERLSADISKASAVEVARPNSETQTHQPQPKEQTMTNSKELTPEEQRRQFQQEPHDPAIDKARSPSEIDPRHYAPLHNALPNDASGYEWKRETGDIQSYQHNQTGGWLHIDQQSQFYDRHAQPIAKEHALEHAGHLSLAVSEISQAQSLTKGSVGTDQGLSL